MMAKKQLYFQRQAQEFWLCDQQGNMRFFNHDNELAYSELIPAFPARVDV